MAEAVKHASDSDLDAFKKDHTVQTVDASKKVRIGFIGTGGIANSHIKAYLNQPDVEIVAGCDLVPGRAKEFFEKYELTGVKTDYKDHTEMLADKSLALDAVSICTYNCQHMPCAVAALDAGLHVLLEKPFAVTTEEAVEIMKAEKRSGKVLSIGFQPRFDGNMQKIGEIDGPRCCKRDSFTAILAAIDFVKEHLGVEMERNIPVCTYSSKNAQCIGKKCPYCKVNHK